MFSRLFLAVVAVLVLVAPFQVRGDDLPEEGLVDYLASRGEPSTFADRRALWERIWPGEPYSGTAAQNIRLRNLLVVEAFAPAVTLKESRLAPGDAVVLDVEMGEHPIGYESELSQSSGPIAGGSFSAGDSRVGIYACQVKSAVATRDLHILITPSAQGDLHVQLITNADVPASLEQVETFLAEELDMPKAEARGTVQAEAALMDRFFAGLSSELILASFTKAAEAWIQDPANQINLVHGGGVCTIAVAASASPFTAPVAGVAWRECGVFFGEAGLGLLGDVLIQAAKDHPELTEEEKGTAVAMIKSIYLLRAAFSLGQSARSITNAAGASETAEMAKAVCELADATLEAMNASRQYIGNDVVGTTLQVVSDAGGKYLTLVCEIAPSASQ